MANEDKKDFNAMLHDNKDMPKFQTITDQKSIEKYGGSLTYRNTAFLQFNMYNRHTVDE